MFVFHNNIKTTLRRYRLRDIYIFLEMGRLKANCFGKLLNILSIIDLTTGLHELLRLYPLHSVVSKLYNAPDITTMPMKQLRSVKGWPKARYDWLRLQAVT
jgi:hypothetical protein